MVCAGFKAEHLALCANDLHAAHLCDVADFVQPGDALPVAGVQRGTWAICRSMAGDGKVVLFTGHAELGDVKRDDRAARRLLVLRPWHGWATGPTNRTTITEVLEDDGTRVHAIGELVLLVNEFKLPVNVNSANIIWRLKPHDTGKG